MPRKDTSSIRVVYLRLDLEKADQKAIYDAYTERAKRMTANSWLIGVLAKELAFSMSGASTIKPVSYSFSLGKPSNAVLSPIQETASTADEPHYEAIEE